MKEYRLSESGGDVAVVSNFTGHVLMTVDGKYKVDMEKYVEYLNGAGVDDRLGAVEE